MTTTRVLLLVPLALAACSDGEPVDIGQDGSGVSDFAGSWDGYAEAYTFNKYYRSDRVRVTLDANGEGTLEVGDAPLLPGPLDPVEAGYNRFQDAKDFIPGFRYPLEDVDVVVGRLRFGVDPWALYASWCTTQPSYENSASPSGYACMGPVPLLRMDP